MRLLRGSRGERPPGDALPASVLVAPVAAGATAGIWYLFGGLPIHLQATSDLGLSAETASSWWFIICATGAVSGVWLSIQWRQPLPMAATLPGWAFLAASAGTFTIEEIAGGTLVAGLMIVAIALTGSAERLMRWLPLPIVMGVFLGSTLGFVTRIFGHLEAQPEPVAGALIGFLAGRLMHRTWLPPLALATVAGLAGSAVGGDLQRVDVAWSLPHVTPMVPAVNVQVVLALALPLAALTMGIGHVQGLGYLRMQGFQPPVRVVTLMTGINSIINACFGGHTASFGRTTAAIMSNDEGGRKELRYIGSLVASGFLVVLALGATTIISILPALPLGLVATLAGLALLRALLDALVSVATSEVREGAFIAVVVAASPLVIGGIAAPFWALIAGMLVAFLLERTALHGLMRER